MQLIFATHNANKVKEIKSFLPDNLDVLSLTEIGITTPIPEPFNTIEENSETKAQFIYNQYNKNCFSEDTGLIVPALNGEPGVKSARYAGENATNTENIEKLLFNLKSIENKTAYFKTVITIIINGNQHQFTGICDGKIINEKKGINGFGYDAIFIPDGSMLTFAEMDLNEKNNFSHRKKAMEQLILFLNK